MNQKIHMFFTKLAKSIRLNILVGIVLVTPVVLTGLIVHWLFTLITNRLLPPDLQTADHALILRIATLTLVVFFLFLTGVLTRNLLGRKVYKLSDRLITSIPVINRIYTFIGQISEAVFARRETMFEDVVLVEYPRRDAYSIAFVTAKAPRNLQRHLQNNDTSEWVSLFIPTTPNPTSGMMIFVNQKDLISLDMSVSNAMKLIVSAGVAAPGSTDDNQPEISLLDKLEKWISSPIPSTIRNAEKGDTP